MLPLSPQHVWTVDDDPQVRRYIAEVLHGVGMIVEQFASADEFLRRWRPRAAGCVLLDVRMPRMTGPELHEWLHREHPSVPVIFLSGYADVPTAVRAMKLGAVDFLEKPFNAQQLIERVNTALRTSTARQSLLAPTDDATPGTAGFSTLTARERDVLAGILAGMRSKLIAAELGIGERTVETHRANIMIKTGARSVAELVALALRQIPDK